MKNRIRYSESVFGGGAARERRWGTLGVQDGSEWFASECRGRAVSFRRKMLLLRLLDLFLSPMFLLSLSLSSFLLFWVFCVDFCNFFHRFFTSYFLKLLSLLVAHFLSHSLSFSVLLKQPEPSSYPPIRHKSCVSTSTDVGGDCVAWNCVCMGGGRLGDATGNLVAVVYFCVDFLRFFQLKFYDFFDLAQRERSGKATRVHRILREFYLGVVLL